VCAGGVVLSLVPLSCGSIKALVVASVETWAKKGQETQAQLRETLKHGEGVCSLSLGPLEPLSPVHRGIPKFPNKCKGGGYQDLRPRGRHWRS
jgi:hypothetical protein